MASFFCGKVSNITKHGKLSLQAKTPSMGAIDTLRTWEKRARVKLASSVPNSAWKELNKSFGGEGKADGPEPRWKKTVTIYAT